MRESPVKRRMHAFMHDERPLSPSREMAKLPSAPHDNTVLVTGSTGYLGSWLVTRLLERGYRVRASVMDPEDKEDLGPILGVPPSLAQRLDIVKADLRVEGDFDAPARGCDGVFHLACPTNLSVEDPQRNVIDLAVQGTLNVLKSCIKSPSVKRVVHASSAGAIRFSGDQLADQVFDESCWTNVEFCMKNNVYGWPYMVGKTLGERAATEFAQQHNLDLVIINPTLVTGPFLLSRIPNTVKGSLSLITGDLFRLPALKRKSYVHIEDVVRALMFLYETPAAKGRHICSAADASIGEIAHLISSRHPEFKIPTDLAYLGEPVVFYYDSSKLKNLGFRYKHTLEDMFDDAIKCCKEKGLL